MIPRPAGIQDACAVHVALPAVTVPRPSRPPMLQTTVVDFTVTQKGLEEQLLGGVIQKEQKSLEEQLKTVLEEASPTMPPTTTKKNLDW